MISEEQMQAIMSDTRTTVAVKIDRLLSLAGIGDELGTLPDRTALLVRDYVALRSDF